MPDPLIKIGKLDLGGHTAYIYDGDGGQVLFIDADVQIERVKFVNFKGNPEMPKTLPATQTPAKPWTECPDCQHQPIAISHYWIDSEYHCPNCGWYARSRREEELP